ncbi:MAG: 30S ribosomal protein S6 [Magnetococcales bacterium]|nr:30S ribosomal protein S6 [Magnetococcales bacterium]
MAFYETIYIVRPDLTNEQVEAVVKRLQGWFTKEGGTISQTEMWGRRTLAYSIDKHANGYYAFHIAEGQGDMIAKVESKVRIDEDILKIMNVRITSPSGKPSPLAMQDERKEGTGRRESPGRE